MLGSRAAALHARRPDDNRRWVGEPDGLGQAESRAFLVVLLTLDR